MLLSRVVDCLLSGHLRRVLEEGWSQRDLGRHGVWLLRRVLEEGWDQRDLGLLEGARSKHRQVGVLSNRMHRLDEIVLRRDHDYGRATELLSLHERLLLAHQGSLIHHRLCKLSTRFQIAL